MEMEGEEYEGVNAAAAANGCGIGRRSIVSMLRFIVFDCYF